MRVKFSNIPSYLLLKAISFSKQKKGRLMPVKVVTRRGYSMTVYKAPEDVKGKKLTEKQNALLNLFLPLSHKIANIYHRKYNYQLSYEDLHATAIQGLITGVQKLTPEKLSKESLTKKHLSAWINKYIQEAISDELKFNGVLREFDHNENTYVSLGHIQSLEANIYNNEDPEHKRLLDIVADDITDPSKIIEDAEISADAELVDERNIYLNKLKTILKPSEYMSLYYNTVEDLSLREIGKRLHMTQVGVFKSLKRAKDKIKKNLTYLKYLRKIPVSKETKQIQLDYEFKNSQYKDIIIKIADAIDANKNKLYDLVKIIDNYKIKPELNNRVYNFYSGNVLKMIYINPESEESSFLWIVDKKL